MKKYILFAAMIFSFSLLWGQKKISPEEANKHLGEKVTITGKIVGGKLVQRLNKPTAILNMGANSSVNIVISADNRKNFPYKPEEYFSQKKVSVTGIINDLNGIAEVSISWPSDIKIEEASGMEFKPLEFEGFNRFF